MKILASLVILSVLLVTGQPHTQAASPTSDWPSLNFDAAQSNNNTTEKSLTPGNVLKLKVKWAVAIADASYPVIAGGRVYIPVPAHGRIHVSINDAATGKPLGKYAKDSAGGLLVAGGTVYLAGYILQAMDATAGTKVAQVAPAPQVVGGTFLDPVADGKTLLVGYASTLVAVPGNLYVIDPTSNQIRWKLPSLSAQGSMGSGHILTQSRAGSDFYDEVSGKKLASRPLVYSDWFIGSTLAYTVATVKKSKAALYAVDGTGRTIWKRVVGPYMATAQWPHAVSPAAVFVQTVRPQAGVKALDPESGTVLWSQAIPDVQRLVLANGILFVLTYGLGQPVKVFALHADTGNLIGNRAIQLSTGYYAFNAQNGLMVADGMLFIRVVGPHGSQLVALGR